MISEVAPPPSSERSMACASPDQLCVRMVPNISAAGFLLD